MIKLCQKTGGHPVFDYIFSEVRFLDQDNIFYKMKFKGIVSSGGHTFDWR